MFAPLLAVLLSAAPASSPTAQVEGVLDDWHAAAAAADEARYFAHFTRDAVFLGTDGTERWTRDEFKAWAHPFFARKKAWSFKAVKRHVAFSKDGQVAWFDEALDTPNMGPARGSGVLVREGSAWRIAQYNLSIPIPNALTNQVKGMIEAQGRKPLPSP